MKNLMLISLIFSVLLFAGCIIPGPIPEPHKEYLINFSTVEKGSNSRITEKTHVVVNTKKELADLYQKMHSNTINSIPAINFDKYTVVAVFMGEKPNSLYGLEVKKVMGSRNQVTVYVNEIQKKLPEGTEILGVAVQPYHIIKIPKTKQLITVKRTQVIGSEIEPGDQYKVDFSLVESGTQSAITEKGFDVVNDSKVWFVVHGKLHSNQSPLPELPEVNFEKETVIAVYSGEKSNPQYGIKINKIVAAKSNLIVYVHETFTKLPEGTSIIQVTVQPYEIVKIKKTDLPVNFNWKEVIIVPVESEMK